MLFGVIKRQSSKKQFSFAKKNESCCIKIHTKHVFLNCFHSPSDDSDADHHMVNRLRLRLMVIFISD